MKAIIEFTPGSDFQKEVGEGAIRITLKALKMHIEGNHKKNKVTLTLPDDCKVLYSDYERTPNHADRP